ncbi:MAG: PKD domain-containing protein, partial [Bacteroidia bacterium]
MRGQQIKIFSVFIFFTTLFGTFTSFAQQVKTIQKSYGGSAGDYALNILPMQDKGFIIAGRTASFGTGGTDILIVRTDSLGKAQWSKTFGGSSDEAFDQALLQAPLEMIQVEDSNFVICTGTKSYGAGGGDIYLIKISKTGNVIWTRTIGRSTTDEIGMSIVRTKDSGFLITGQTKSTGGTGDVIVVKTNDTGGVMWTKAYGSTGDEAGFRIIPAIDGKNFLIVGLANVQQYDYYLLKINGSGALLWSKVYGGSVYDVPQDVDQLSDGTIYISGNTTTSAFGGGSGATADNDLYLMKTDSSGNVIWGKHYGHNSRESFRSLYYNSDNTFDAPGLGFSYGPGNPQSLYYLKLDTAGNVKRMKTYGTSGSQTSSHGQLFVKLVDGGFATVGCTNGFGAGDFDFYFIKADSTGNTNNCKVATQTPKTKDRKPSVYSHTTTTNSITASVGSGATVKSIAINNGTGTLKDAFICEPFVAGFEWKNACEDQPTQFYDTTYRSATAWVWNFGDPSSSSNTSKSKNPTHTYKDTGTYTVKLVASKTGAKDSITYKVRVYPTPQAVSSTKDTTVCLGEAVQLNTSATAGTFYWSPGEFLSDSLAQQPWAYPTKTTKFVLKVSNTSGCSATDTVKITIDTSSTCKKITGISGIINKYSKVTKIDTCDYYLTLDSASNFKVGDKAMLIQMKGAVIDTSNTS